MSEEYTPIDIESLVPKASFEVLYKDKVCSKVTINGGRTTVERYDSCPMHCMFNFDEMDTYVVMEILEGRCWPRNRAGIKEILDSLGLKAYHPLEIVKKTHGLKRDDYVWIRFEGEDLTYDDVKIRE